MKKRYKWLIGTFLVLLSIFLMVLLVIRQLTYAPLSSNLAILTLDHVEDHGHAIVLDPAGDVKATIIFYPGGFVEPESYLLLANALTFKDYRVIVVRIPLNLAILGINRANDVLEWVEGPLILAGHSLGGASAAFYVDSHRDLVDGLILMAAYPADSIDLKDLPLAVLSIQADQDAIIDRDALERTKSQLPPHTVFETIEGGDHAGFGSYGDQRGDGEASISRDAQRALIVDFIETWFYDTIGGS